MVVGLKKAETKGRIVQGMGVEEDGVGFVGAIAGTYDHEVCARVLGCPVQLVYVAERLFEEMPEAAARMWPGVFVGGLPVDGSWGATLRRRSVGRPSAWERWGLQWGWGRRRAVAG